MATDRFDSPHLPDALPPDGCKLGWQQSLELLARLVEPEIPGECPRGTSAAAAFQ